jgi:hypothetical protein
VAEGIKSVKGNNSSKRVKLAQDNFFPNNKKTNKAERGAQKASNNSPNEGMR